MSFRKRKRRSREIKCILFPDDVETSFQRAGREPLSSASTARSWQRCGDSFLDSPVDPGRKLSTIKELVLSPPVLTAGATQYKEDIAWSSSDSQQSEEEDQQWRLSRAAARQQQRQQRRRGQRLRTLAASVPPSRLHPGHASETDDVPAIDTDSNVDEPVEPVEADSGQQISDFDSESCQESPEPDPTTDINTEAAQVMALCQAVVLAPEWTGRAAMTTLSRPSGTASSPDAPSHSLGGVSNLPPLQRQIRAVPRMELELSGYVSDGENMGHAITPSSLGSGVSPSQAGESSKQSVSSWVRYAQALLQTPQKPTYRQFKTPEDSGNKKRKFQSGGLAERLSRLQSRQRSAVSFWRHQSLSHASAATADRPGVLVLEVLEVLEECSMQVARCERHRPRGDDSQSEASAHLLVLFSRETVAHLMPAPKDIIHIYPPWQSLSMEGFSSSVILNTHLSQKVHSAPKPSDLSPAGLLALERCPPYFLCQTFGLLEAPRTSEENGSKQVAKLDALISLEGPGTLTGLSLSLLEVVEGLGQAGSVGQDVEVVVQRVYAIAVADISALSFLKPRVQPGTSCPHPSTEKGKTRLCVLVQDSYGMFSVVQLHLLPRKDDLHHYSRMWQGRTCLLRGVKVVQRVTRVRCSRLFSLIDSLWPPVMPPRDHRNPPSTTSETRAAGPAPSFCYLLSGEESSVQLAEGSPLSPLYFPPTPHTLGDILQTELKSFRCSFVATVIYQRVMQGSDVGQGEVWLVLTDPSLQEDKPERPHRRTAALCVSTSCVLTSSVVRALDSSAGCRMSFRDVVKEHGLLHCVEHSVVEIFAEAPERIAESSIGSGSLSQSLGESPALPRPVRLDPLSPEVTPNSLCSLTGVVVGVDEDTAYSWPVCNHCRSDNLDVLPGRNDSFHCGSCKSVVDKPDTRIQLEVFLSSSFGDCTLKVKLQQKTIGSILNAAALEGDDFAGYDVESVLGKEVGPLAVYVRTVSRKPALRMGLEEVSL